MLGLKLALLATCRNKLCTKSHITIKRCGWNCCTLVETCYDVTSILEAGKSLKHSSVKNKYFSKKMHGRLFMLFSGSWKIASLIKYTLTGSSNRFLFEAKAEVMLLANKSQGDSKLKIVHKKILRYWENWKFWDHVVGNVMYLNLGVIERIQAWSSLDHCKLCKNWGYCEIVYLASVQMYTMYVCMDLFKMSMNMIL